MSAKKQIILKASPRAEDVNLDEVRKSGWIPIVLYGRGFKNLNLQVRNTEFSHVFAAAGESTLIDLESDGVEDTKVLIKEVQTDPVKDTVIHIDLYKIKMDEFITTDIPLVFIGEAPAVKDLGGIVVKNLDRIEVKCLPGDLVHDIQIDISQLKEFNDSISVGDIEAPPGIEFLAGSDVQIVSISEPRKVEEETVEEESEKDVVEKVGQVGADEEPAEEGAVPAEGESKAKEEKEEKLES